jgi:thioredoxin 2
MKDRLHIVCPHCRTLNRVPALRLKDRPQCGQCHASLFTGQPLVLTAENFDLHLSRSDIPLVVDFWASWCGPCQVMAPAFEEAAKLLEPDIRLGKVNTEEERSLATRFGIVSIPTVVMFREGREIARQRGAMETQEIVRWVRSCAQDT